MYVLEASLRMVASPALNHTAVVFIKFMFCHRKFIWLPKSIVLVKSAVAEHGINQEHTIQLKDTKVLSTKTDYVDRMIREAIELEWHPNIINYDANLFISLLIHILINM